MGTSGSATLIMPGERVQRTLTRLAYQIVERNRGARNLELIGIRHRGSAVARVLGEQIRRVEEVSLPVHELDVTRFRDDIEDAKELRDESHIHRDLTDRDIILVDDVLFTGRTARAALDAVVYYGRPRTIQLVVLVDRGHREYPIQPDYLGRFLQTKHQERVVVDVENDFSIYIEE